LWGKGYKKPGYKYPYESGDGRENLEASDEVLRVLRGGSFDLSQFDARCAFRYWGDPGVRGDGLGFRVVVSPISSPLPSDTLSSGALGPSQKAD
jgi:iron(II)-dependent oxidoreductase